jgi:hypothetical protein
MSIELCARPARDAASVAEHADAVGEAIDLVQPVRDVHDRLAGCAQGLDVLEEPLGIGVAQRARGLVHDEDARIAPERARDFHELPLANREKFHGC